MNNSMSEQFRRQHHWVERGVFRLVQRSPLLIKRVIPCFAFKKESFTRFQVVAEETRALTDS